jgi:hypothetical protein
MAVAAAAVPPPPLPPPPRTKARRVRAARIIVASTVDKTRAAAGVAAAVAGGGKKRTTSEGTVTNVKRGKMSKRTMMRTVGVAVEAATTRQRRPARQRLRCPQDGPKRNLTCRTLKIRPNGNRIFLDKARQKGGRQDGTGRQSRRPIGPQKAVAVMSVTVMGTVVSVGGRV